MAVLCALALSVCASGTVSAAPSGADAYPDRYLQLFRSYADHTTASAWLTCGPDEGSHPDPRTACISLTEAEGDFTRIIPLHEPCTLEYDPVTDYAYGTWNGETVDYQHTYPNPCVARDESGGVFDYPPRGY